MTRTHTGRAALLAAALALFSLAGCGNSMGTVTGEVSYENEPVGEGSITLTPADGKGPVVGGTIENGKYTVTKVPPGPKIVKIEAYKKVNFASSSEEMMRRAAEAKKRGDDSGLVDPADVIPPNAEGNNAPIEVKPGNQTCNFDLKKPAKGKGR